MQTNQIGKISMHKNCFKSVVLLSLLGISTLFITGCEQSVQSQQVNKLKIFSGSNQYALPGEEFSKELVVTAEAPVEKGIFGPGAARPAAKAKLNIVLPENAALNVEPKSAETDLGGAARFKVTAGKLVGDHYFTIVPESNPAKAITAHFTVGAQITGGEQEVAVNTIVPKPISVKLVRQDGKPAANIPVYFNVVSSPIAGTAGAVISPETANTDSKGEVKAMVKAGKASGEYVLLMLQNDNFLFRLFHLLK